MTRLRAAGALALAGLLIAAAAPESSFAHGLVGKQDLPIPRWLFAWAASLVLVASFVGLATLWATPRLQRVHERRLAGVPRWLEVLAGAAGIAGFALIVYAGFAGEQSSTDNVVPTFVYVVFWIGIPFVSALFGDVFRAVNPWLAIGKAAGWLVRHVSDSVPEPLPYPARLGRWPAVAGVLAFAWVELTYANKDDPSQLAVMALAYAVAQLVGMSLYGAAAWSHRGDAFSVYFGTFARVAPLRWRERALHLRPPLGGAPTLGAVPGTVALLCTMIGTTSFDGFSQGGLWTSLADRLQTFFGDLGFGPEHALEAAGSVGLVMMVLFVSLLYRLGAMGMHDVNRRLPTSELAAQFAHTLIPIALAYVVAHYFSLLAYQGQAMTYLVSDPLGTGADVFGTASGAIDYTWIGATGIWYVQCGALVLGHVAGLTLAHDRALAIYPDPREATRSQYWMLAVMVAFTSLGLWLLSAAAQ
ncbi:MAG: fenitrothion hydrolase [Solirubrobacteraceae bacterium]